MIATVQNEPEYATRETAPTLFSCASLGSVSYGHLDPHRLLAILYGVGTPMTIREQSRVRQALFEAPPTTPFDLAAEIGMTFEELDQRVFELFGERIGRT